MQEQLIHLNVYRHINTDRTFYDFLLVSVDDEAFSIFGIFLQETI